MSDVSLQGQHAESALASFRASKQTDQQQLEQQQTTDHQTLGQVIAQIEDLNKRAEELRQRLQTRQGAMIQNAQDLERLERMSELRPKPPPPGPGTEPPALAVPAPPDTKPSRKRQRPDAAE